MGPCCKAPADLFVKQKMFLEEKIALLFALRPQLQADSCSAVTHHPRRVCCLFFSPWLRFFNWVTVFMSRTVSLLIPLQLIFHSFSGFTEKKKNCLLTVSVSLFECEYAKSGTIKMNVSQKYFISL